MGTSANVKSRSNLDVKPLITSAIDSNNINDCNDTTFYPTYDEKNVEQYKNIKTEVVDEYLIEIPNSSDIQQEIEISENEYDSDEDQSSIISGLSNDHNYNMSPIVEPLSPISNSSSSRATPDTCLASSDHGYDSQPSPTPSTSTSFDEMPLLDLDRFWDDPILELFPTLAGSFPNQAFTYFD
jgi:hypothetical protein